MAKFSAPALGAVLAGSVFAYAGFKGKNLGAAFQALVTGKSPTTAASANPITAVLPTGTQAIPPGPELPGGTVGGVYDHAGLMKLWVQAGGNPAAANNAACHGMQESSGEPAVTSPNPDGGTNVGLWQLDTKGKGAGFTIAQLQNPMTNARITVMQTRNGTDWSAWATPGC